MKYSTLAVAIALLMLPQGNAAAAKYKWSGMHNPAKVSAGDGLDQKQLGQKIGRFITLPNQDLTKGATLPPLLRVDASTPPPPARFAPGMTPLFDGRTLAGWTQMPADSWTVRNGIVASLGAARGVMYTNQSFGRYRVMFDVRHHAGKPDHRAGVLVFCEAPTDGQKPLDTLGGIQFQVPNGGHWDYRAGFNNAGDAFFKRLVNPGFDEHAWSRVEILVDPGTGTARMAVAQPIGGAAVEVLNFKDPAAGRSGPFALQMHNKGLFDEFANIAIQRDPPTNDLFTLEAPKGAR